MGNIKTAFVTGANGFLGRHMVKELESRGVEVYTCDATTDVDLSYVVKDLDIRFDLVVHLAYHTGSQQDKVGLPMNLVKNLQLDGQLLEWALKTKQKRVLYFSSADAYPIRNQLPDRWATGELMQAYGAMGAGVIAGGPGYIRLTEDMIGYDEARQPNGNYGWGKLTGERMAQAAISSGLPVYIVRPFEVYAAAQNPAKLYRNIIIQARAMKAKIEIPVRKDDVRDFIHVTDAVAGALAIVESDTDAPVNLCTGIGTKMSDLVKMACAEIEHEAEIIEPEGAKLFKQVGDPDLFNAVYNAQVALERAVSVAMKWTTRVR